MSKILVQIGAESILDRTSPQATMRKLLCNNNLQARSKGFEPSTFGSTVL